MKQIALLLDPTRRLYTLLAMGTFFLILTAQVFWSTIHGDGAVYAWIIREIGEAGLWTSQLPNWDRTRVFAEHPYLFFYFSNLFTEIFGYSDLIVKLPNYAVALFSLGALYMAARSQDSKNNLSQAGHFIGLIAGYILIFNPTYIIQVGQPSLDPMAQLLAFLSVGVWIIYRQAFLSGFLLGLAFLTKGLEILPHLAALGAFLLIHERQKNTGYKQIVAFIGIFSLGLALPVCLWLGYDFFRWNGQWLATYWDRQFTQRFLNKNNLQFIWHFGIILTFLQVYIIEIFVLISAGLLALSKLSKQGRKFFSTLQDISPFTVYFLLYVVFNLLAFWLIKKDSSQHLTGILLFGAVPAAQALYYFWQQLKWKTSPFLVLFFFTLSLGYWSWYVFSPQKNPDMWTAIKTESELQSQARHQLPIMVKSESPEAYGFYYTIQWYFPAHTIYFNNTAEESLNGREVLLITENGNGQVRASQVIYGHEDKIANDP